MDDRWLDDALKRYYARERWNPDDRRRLCLLLEQSRVAVRSRRRLLHATAAGTLTALIVLLAFLLHGVSRSDNLMDALILDAATGEKRLPTPQPSEEVSLSGRSALGSVLVEPEIVARASLRLVGVHDVTLAGHPAVRITAFEPGGRACTLYELRAAGDLSRLRSAERKVDGVVISVWQEKGWLIVLARAAERG